MSGGNKDGIFGYYGHANFGDDLFAQMMFDKASDLGLCPATILSESEGVRSPVSQYFPVIRRLNLISANLNLLKKSRSITLGGGSVIGPLSPMSLRHFQMLKSRLCKVPFLALGVGLRSLRVLQLSKLLGSFDWIAFRSELDYWEARKILKKEKLFLMPDLIYADNVLLDSKKYEYAKSFTIIPTLDGQIGRSIASDPDSIKRWARRELSQFCERYALDLKILLAQGRKSDLIAAEKLRQIFESVGFKTEEVKVHRSVEQTVADLKSSKFVVSDRFHGGVVSHRLNIPFFLTGYQKKNRHFNLETMGGMFAQDVLPSIKKIYEIIELQNHPAHMGQKMKLQLQANEAIEVWSRILTDRLG